MKKLAIILGSIAQWLAHWPSTEEIIGLNPFERNVLVFNSSASCGQTQWN